MADPHEISAQSLARRIGALAVSGGTALVLGTVLINPPLLLALVLIGNAAVAIWWGIHLFVTRRPW